VTRVVVLADTHLRPGRDRRLPDAAYDELDRADLVLHAGDLVTADVFHELGGFAPTRAVLGNNDVGLTGVLPETDVFDVDGVRVAMIHDSGPRAGRERRMKRRFPDAAIVVFGHSHIPWNNTGLDGQILFNPGSAVDRRMQPSRTLGVLDLRAGHIRDRRIVPLD
jgi:putative phosphoesterase